MSRSRNARLFDETKRLLAETNERAAELAIVNSVQLGLASNLDVQAMYDLISNKIARDTFDAQVVDMGLYEPRGPASSAARTQLNVEPDTRMLRSRSGQLAST